jgi:ATP-dependent DNA helicase RecQ
MAKNLNQTCFSENILAIDLETLPGGNLFHIGAVFRDKRFERKNITCAKTALRDLSDFSEEADYILGHNIAKHDLPVVKAIMPDASFLTLPVIDTLFLSPLVFPENPYHKLIKNYKPVKNSKNDPVADARLSMDVFDDQMATFLALYQT